MFEAENELTEVVNVAWQCGSCIAWRMKWEGRADVSYISIMRLISKSRMQERSCFVWSKNLVSCPQNFQTLLARYTTGSQWVLQMDWTLQPRPHQWGHTLVLVCGERDHCTNIAWVGIVTCDKDSYSYVCQACTVFPLLNARASIYFRGFRRLIIPSVY